MLKPHTELTRIDVMERECDLCLFARERLLHVNCKCQRIYDIEIARIVFLVGGINNVSPSQKRFIENRGFRANMTPEGSMPKSKFRNRPAYASKSFLACAGKTSISSAM